MTTKQKCDNNSASVTKYLQLILISMDKYRLNIYKILAERPGVAREKKNI